MTAHLLAAGTILVLAFIIWAIKSDYVFYSLLVVLSIALYLALVNFTGWC